MTKNECIADPSFASVFPKPAFTKALKNLIKGSLVARVQTQLSRNEHAGLNNMSMAQICWFSFFEFDATGNQNLPLYQCQKPSSEKLLLTPEKEVWCRGLIADRQRSLKDLYGDSSFIPKRPTSQEIDLFEQAAQHLQSQDNTLNTVYQECVSDILVVSSTDLFSFTIPQALGLVVISPKEHWQLPHYVEAIVHESTHVELLFRQQLDPLLTNGHDLSINPLRQDSRPLNGTFHAALVMIRTCRALSLLPDSPQKCQLLDEFEPKVQVALDEVGKQAQFTSTGARLFNDMRRTMFF